MLDIVINNYEVFFIAWNLFLLIIPFFLCRLLSWFYDANKFRSWYNKFIGILIAFLWLIFIPNTIYVIADMRHIIGFCPVNEKNICISNAWMIMFFFTYASIGWVAFVYLINQMKDTIKKIFPYFNLSVYLFFIMPVISLGMLLGLINRWNSWEVFISPSNIISDALKYITDFTYFKNWLLFTIFLYVLYYAGNYIFKPRPTSGKRN